MSFVNHTVLRHGVLVVALAAVSWPCFNQLALGFGRNFGGSAVGGVLVDANGVLTNPEVDQVGKLKQLRQQMLAEVPGDLKQAVPLRKVSLKRLEQAIAERRAKAQMPLLTDEMNYLAGLTRIQYVFIYPEENDIVLAGPAEGWTVHEKGHIVGTTSGMPTLQLDHLVIALRTAAAAARTPISCSIDPTPEGVARFQQFIKGQAQFSQTTLDGVEQALGRQTIKVSGVPATSDFARIMVAADFRMKRLAMGFDPSPIKGLPSYMQMISSAGAPQNMMPRWWMAPNYQALLQDPDGLAWQLRGPGVKTMTEDSLFAADGSRQQTGKTSLVAQRWADSMTENYETLAAKEPIFGELRNIMDMAVVGALIVKERLTEKAGYQMPVLMDQSQLAFNEEFPAPKQVDSIASALRKGRSWIISASGGVDMASWQVADKKEQSSELNLVRKQNQSVEPASWWWN